MHVPEIIEVKEHLSALKQKGLVKDWELPYENLLTRRSAAIFFFTPTNEQSMETIIKELGKYDNFSHRINEEQKLSKLQFRVTFSKEQKDLNNERKLQHVSEP